MRTEEVDIYLADSQPYHRGMDCWKVGWAGFSVSITAMQICDKRLALKIRGPDALITPLPDSVEWSLPDAIGSDGTVTAEVAGTRGDQWTIELNGLVIALAILRVYKHQARLAIAAPEDATIIARDPYEDEW